MLRKSFLLLMFLVVGLRSLCWAQELEKDSLVIRSQQIYDYIVAGQGDSICNLLNDDLKTKITSATFNGMFEQLEKQCGKLSSAGEWKKASASGLFYYYKDVKFERFPLRFLTAFDKDGKVNTIRFVPVPVTPSAQEATYNKEKIREKEIEIQSGKYTLPGTLTLPKEGTHFPVVILVHGSGPNDRNETYGPNKPFQDIAWGLAEQGIAVIRYDKRTKVYGEASFSGEAGITLDNEVVDDVLAAISLVETFPDLNPDKIYILGHSLGGMLAPRIAERAEKELSSRKKSGGRKNILAGIIIVAGNARSLEDVLLEQVEYLSSLNDSSGISKKTVDELKRQVYNVKQIGTKKFDESIPLPLNIPYSYWWSIKNYKQVKVAARLKLPILILQGERDYQVTRKDFELWLLGLSHNKNVQSCPYPKLNHFLQEGIGKSTPVEYNQANPVPTYVIDDIASFVKSGSLK